MATVYLHIGTHKTGTTTLQRFLFENRQELHTHNLVYPESGLHPGLKGHHPIAFHLAGKKSYFRNRRPAFDLKDIAENFAHSLARGKNLIISSEDFSRLSLGFCPSLPSIVKNLFPASTEFRVLVYLRRQDKFIESYYSWQRKGGRMMGSQIDMRYVNKICYLPYSKLLNTWAQVFGQNNVIVRPFEKESLYRNDLIRDFLYEVGISKWGVTEVKSPHLNTAFTPRQLEVMDYLRDALSGPQSLISRFSRNFIDEFSDLFGLKKGARRSMTPELADDILEYFSDDNNLIAKMYLGRNTLFLNDSICSNDQPRIPLEASDFNEIDRILPSEIERFNKGRNESCVSGHIERSNKIKLRASFYRKTLRIGMIRVRTGRLLRICNMLFGRLGIGRI